MEKHTVAVGIPVHNEADNILNLLESIVRQSAENYVLEHIYVMCDGTTDGTDRIVKEYSQKYPFIKVINDGQRKGKMQRLMDIYQRNSSDYICIFDGDVVLGKKDTMEEIVATFSSADVVAVSANNQPITSDTFIGKLINQWSHIWYLVRVRYRNGNNVFTIRGCGMALRKDFAKTIKFPPHLASETQFIYFTILSQHKLYKLAKKAIVYYRKPDSIHDQILQLRRSSPEKNKLTDIFGKWIKEYYMIPRKDKVYGLLQGLIENPLLTPMAAVLNWYIDHMPYKDIREENEVQWKRSVSTKRPIPVPF